MELVVVAYILLAFVIIGLLVYMVSIFNQLVMLRLNIDKSFHNIDVLLKQRADEIPQLVSVVQQSMHYEAQTLEQLTRLRDEFLNTHSTEKQIQLSNEINQMTQSVLSRVEAYPDLKANENILALQVRISEIENAIADRMEFFNDSVTLYNIAIKEFPNLILAKLLSYKDHALLKQEHRQDGI